MIIFWLYTYIMIRNQCDQNNFILWPLANHNINNQLKNNSWIFLKTSILDLTKCCTEPYTWRALCNFVLKTKLTFSRKKYFTFFILIIYVRIGKWPNENNLWSYRFCSFFQVYHMELKPCDTLQYYLTCHISSETNSFLFHT